MFGPLNTETRMKISVEISEELNEKLKALAVKDKRTKMAYVATILEAHAAKVKP